MTGHAVMTLSVGVVMEGRRLDGRQGSGSAASVGLARCTTSSRIVAARQRQLCAAAAAAAVL